MKCWWRQDWYTGSPNSTRWHSVFSGAGGLRVYSVSVNKCVCVRACCSVRSERPLESRVCVYMAEVPMTNVVRTSFWFFGEKMKSSSIYSSTVILSLQTCVFNLSKHSMPSFLHRYKTMLFVLHINYEFTILPIFFSVPQKSFLMCGVTGGGPSFPPVIVSVSSLLLYFKLLLLALFQPQSDL